MCISCRADAPPASQEEIERFLKSYPGWEIAVNDGIPQLCKVFRFPDFAAALAFTDKVGELAERAGHHPAILTEWGRVTVRWWTHKIRNIHHNDLVMAARTDRAASDV